ncbi:MAG: 2-succinyl-5-enolpyruvyl-6-hydroxy-3-cyclohexene-1-carboxylic-acid synthase [Candidatus Hydrogenedentes bacterium]|nr:2-succinyl-5-enolpyruvyl-6-hydroxy-3-cyclohexene-1-carboxylic-acid synthase [Candidatus Hydrogenedentota bacterium]
MITDAPNLNILWAELIVEELIRNGVDHFVISPGSRSTPLTVAAARNPRAKTTVHFDERGAAFFALGVAKALGKPAALICTSGTAVANYFPALIEASMSYVPLVVLTADRPPELQNTGANQTIDQTRIYGEYVRHFVAMPCPDETILPEYVLTAIDHAVAAARRSPSGPVHINCAYREPLAPPLNSIQSDAPQPWRDSRQPYTTWVIDEDRYYVDDMAPIIDELQKLERVLLLIGQEDCRKSEFSVGNTLELGLTRPLLADVTSSARSKPIDAKRTIPVSNYDLLLFSPRFRDICSPDAVVHVGGAIVSKRLSEHLAHVKPHIYVRIAPHLERVDPCSIVTHRVCMSAVGFLAHVKDEQPVQAESWVRNIIDFSRRAEDIVAEILSGETRLTEPLVANLLCGLQPADEFTAIFAGNSMPVRYLEMYSGLLHATTHVIANRGASGIDGNVATAAGYAAASGVHVTAMVGDLAALHDLGSLALLKSNGVRVTLVLLNNDGGGIFHFLPIAEHSDVFEKYFATPHGLHFEDAARMFGLPYSRPATKDEFVAAFQRARESGGSSIIEVVTDREENLRLHRRIGEAVVNALENL